MPPPTFPPVPADAPMMTVHTNPIDPLSDLRYQQAGGHPSSPEDAKDDLMNTSPDRALVFKELFGDPPRNFGTAALEQNADPLHLAGSADSGGIWTYPPQQKALGAEAEEVNDSIGVLAQEKLTTYGREMGESKHVTRTSVERYEP